MKNKKHQQIIFIVETSANMAGNKIQALNQALSEYLHSFNEIFEENNELKIMVSVLEYSTGAKWMHIKPLEISEFIFKKLSVSGESVDMGAAFDALYVQLTNLDFENNYDSLCMPIIILFSTSQPTDEWSKRLSKLYENSLFNYNSIKLAVAIGDDANKDVFQKFTGTSEGVFETHNMDGLGKFIRRYAIGRELISGRLDGAIDNDTYSGNDSPYQYQEFFSQYEYRILKLDLTKQSKHESDATLSSALTVESEKQMDDLCNDGYTLLKSISLDKKSFLVYEKETVPAQESITDDWD
jgi:uncharacterized protein YegL